MILIHSALPPYVIKKKKKKASPACDFQLLPRIHRGLGGLECGVRPPWRPTRSPARRVRGLRVAGCGFRGSAAGRAFSRPSTQLPLRAGDCAGGEGPGRKGAEFAALATFWGPGGCLGTGSQGWASRTVRNRVQTWCAPQGCWARRAESWRVCVFGVCASCLCAFGALSATNLENPSTALRARRVKRARERFPTPQSQGRAPDKVPNAE